MTIEQIIKRLMEKHNLYTEETKELAKEYKDVSYWEGKASGLLLAMEIVKEFAD